MQSDNIFRTVQYKYKLEQIYFAFQVRKVMYFDVMCRTEYLTSSLDYKKCINLRNVLKGKNKRKTQRFLKRGTLCVSSLRCPDFSLVALSLLCSVLSQQLPHRLVWSPHKSNSSTQLALVFSHSPSLCLESSFWCSS